MRELKVVLIAFVLVAIVAFAALYLGQRMLLFPAPNVSFPYAPEEGVELIELEIGRAFLALPYNSHSPAPLLVFAHGNAELAHWSIESFRYFRVRGFAVLLLEYPGYGGAPGEPSAKSTVKSAILALDQTVVRDDIDGSRVIAYGRSIGSGVASQLALRRNTVALILESPFTSLKALVAETGLPAFLLRDRFDNAAAISTLDLPIFLYHGVQDRIIPVEHSDRLAALAKKPTVLKAHCGHNDCPRPWAQILRFLESTGIFREDKSTS